MGPLRKSPKSTTPGEMYTTEPPALVSETALFWLKTGKTWINGVIGQLRPTEGLLWERVTQSVWHGNGPGILPLLTCCQGDRWKAARGRKASRALPHYGVSSEKDQKRFVWSLSLACYPLAINSRLRHTQWLHVLDSDMEHPLLYVVLPTHITKPAYFPASYGMVRTQDIPDERELSQPQPTKRLVSYEVECRVYIIGTVYQHACHMWMERVP